MDNNPQLDERIWQAWIQKNAAQDRVRFRRRVKVIGLIALCLAFSAVLFEIHKVSADVFELRPMPGFRSKTALGRRPIARMHFADDVDAMLHKPSRSVFHRRGSRRPSSSMESWCAGAVETAYAFLTNYRCWSWWFRWVLGLLAFVSYGVGPEGNTS